MLIDLIPIHYLPYFVVWVDWCFYVYWSGLVIIFLYFIILNKIMKWDESNFEIVLSSIFIWLIGCLIVNGYVVG